MESASTHDEKQRQKKPKDLLSLKSINSVLTKTLNKRNTWVAQNGTPKRICHMKHSKNILRYMFCDALSEDLREFSQTANDQAISDLYGHDLTLHYLNETVRSQIDSVVLQNNDHIITEQAKHIEEAILLSINLFYCCRDQDVYLSVDIIDRKNKQGEPILNKQGEPIQTIKYVGTADTEIKISYLTKEFDYQPNISSEDTLHLKAILCKELYKAFIKPLSTDARYQWLYKLLNRFNYIKAEQSQISEQFLFDFLAIISILALDLSDCSRSTEPYMRAVYSFFNIEGEFGQAYIAYVANSCSQPITLEQDNVGTHEKTQNNLIGQQIQKNQTVQELQKRIKQIIDLIIRDLLRNSQYVALSRDFKEMENHLDYVRGFYKRLRDDFDNTSSTEHKQEYVDELYRFYDSQRTRELPSLVSKLTIEKTR